ncbi:MAG: TPM domain-containing protein [Muricoprocola sp.]
MVRRLGKKTHILSGMMSLLFFFMLASMHVHAATEIIDDADLISRSEISAIQEKADQIDHDYKMNVLVYTTDRSSNKSSRDKIEEQYEKLGYTDNGAHGGIALIIDLDNGEMNLVTDGDMIYYITDEREEKIYDDGYEYASDGEYGMAMYAMLEKTYSFLEAGVPDGQYTYDSETGRIVRYKSLSRMDILIAFGVALVVSLISYGSISRSYGTVKKYKYSVSQNANIKITGQQDRLVNQFVTERRIPKENPGGSSGRGDSGRTTTHSSGSGHTYGGGNGRKL